MGAVGALQPVIVKRLTVTTSADLLVHTTILGIMHPANPSRYFVDANQQCISMTSPPLFMVARM
jgi:hypothetical protein